MGTKGVREHVKGSRNICATELLVIKWYSWSCCLNVLIKNYPEFAHNIKKKKK